MSSERFNAHTYSVCPVCLKRIPAQRVCVGEEVFLKKECPDHGKFSTVIWRGKLDISGWIGDIAPIAAGENLNCPTACGLCPDHRQESCCVLLEITSRCNLSCRFCFADNKNLPDPPFEQVCSWLSQLAEPGKTLVQLSGGEPTVRDDLPQIIAAAKKAGCKYVQLNSNGIRLAEDKEYVKALAEAGLSFVFMQFDGTEDNIYQSLRGRPLLITKKQAIANCAEYNIGVTLVPTLVPGINTHNIGEILRFAVKNSPAVRGVHFQPVSYFGRIPELPGDSKRFTLDELLWQIKEQAGELIQLQNLLPSSCDHPLCGFHGDFIVMPDGLVPLSKRREKDKACCLGTAPAERNREFVARRWQRRQAGCCEADSCCGTEPDIHSMDGFLQKVRSHGFTVTAMAFQDAGNLDLERLRQCSLHVFDKGRFVPFCAYYLSRWEQL